MPDPRTVRRRRALLRGLLVGGLLAAALPATACDGEFVSLVVPYPPGGSVDVVARVLAEGASRRSGKTFVLQHLAGASGAIGARYVARAAPDGCTVLAGNLNVIAIAPTSQATAGYAPEDLTPVAKVGSTGLLLVASPELGIERIDQLTWLSRGRDRPLSIGHPGTETLQYLAATTIEQRLGTPPFARVPYRGGGPLLNDVVHGHVDLAVVAEPSARALIARGRLVVLAHLDDWFAREGLQPVPDWSGWFVPRGTRPQARRWLERTLTDTLAQPEVRAALAALGSVPPTEAEQRRFAQDVAQDVRRYQRR